MAVASGRTHAGTRIFMEQRKRGKTASISQRYHKTAAKEAA